MTLVTTLRASLPAEAADPGDADTVSEIRAIHSEHEARYGGPRMVDERREHGYEVGKHRVGYGALVVSRW